MTENLPAQRTPVKVNLSEPLTDLDQAMRLADALSKSTLVPDSLHGKPASVLHVILTGQALDLHWTEAIRVIYSPGNGQIGMRAQFLLSQLRKAGHKYTAEYSEDGESCTFTLVRKDEPDNPYTSTFSRQDAIDAKLVNKDNWTRYFKRMLRARAITDCVGFAAPEVLLGFVVEGDEPEAAPVQLQPPSPAPPEPAGEAAPGGQAAQAERTGTRQVEELTEGQAGLVAQLKAAEQAAQLRLRELDEKMRGVDPVGTNKGGWPSEPSDMGGNQEDAAAPDAVAEDEAPDFAGGAADPPAGDTATASTPPTAAPEAEPSAKAKTVVLSEWFTALGYDPKHYRAQVLRACSVWAKRRITGVRDLRATEVMHLSNELAGISRRKDELAPVSRLADEIDKWEQAWRGTDPEGYAAYEEGT